MDHQSQVPFDTDVKGKIIELIKHKTRNFLTISWIFQKEEFHFEERQNRKHTNTARIINIRLNAYNETSKFVCSMNNRMWQICWRVILLKEGLNTVTDTAPNRNRDTTNYNGELMRLRFGWIKISNPFRRDIFIFLQNQKLISKQIKFWLSYDYCNHSFIHLHILAFCLALLRICMF